MAAPPGVERPRGRARAGRLARAAVRLAGLALALGVACAATALSAQAASTPPAPAGVVEGQVVEARGGAPVPGALVRVRGTRTETVTGADGRFTIPVEAHGPVTVRVLVLGYAPAEREVAAGGSPVTIALTEAPPDFEEEVTVLGEVFAARQPGVPSEVTIGRADLGLLRGVLADDPFRAVQAMPGVVSGDDFTAEFSIRGSGPERVGVLVDGVLAPVVVHTVQGRGDTGSVSMINSDLVAEVAVSGGSPAATTGNRTGGRVEFVTRDGSRDRTLVRALAGVAVASVTAEGPIGEARRGSWLVAGRGSYAGWIARRVDPSIDLSFVFADVNAKLAWDVSSAHRVSLLAIGGRMHVEERQQDNRVNVLDQGRNESAFVLGSWRWQASPRLAVTHQATALYNRFANTNPFGQELGRGRVAGGGYRVEAAWAQSARWLWRGGGSVDGWRQDLRLVRRATRPPTVTVTDTVDATERLWGTFAQVTATPSPRVSWTAGARADASMSTRWGTIAPWANAAWEFADAWRLRGGSGLYGQFASLEQSSGRRGGGDLEPAGSLHADLAIERRVSPSLRWQVGVYAREDANVPRLPNDEPRLVAGRPVPASATSRWDTRLESRARGVEALVHRRAPTGVSGWIAYTYGHVRDRDVVTGERFDGDHDQRHALNAFASWRGSHRLGLSARLRYGSGLPVIGYYTRVADADDGTPQFDLSASRNVARFPAYARFDVRLERAFVRGDRRLTLFAEVLNVLNRANYGPGGAGGAEKLFPVLPSTGVLVEW